MRHDRRSHEVKGALFLDARGLGCWQAAFSLLEVMIALGIFFVALFAILELTSQSIASARRLQRVQPDVTSLAAELSLTNRLEEGTESGDFGDVYPGYQWTRTIAEVSSNGLFQVNFSVVHPTKDVRSGNPPVETTLAVLLFRPESATSFRSKAR